MKKYIMINLLLCLSFFVHGFAKGRTSSNYAEITLHQVGSQGKGEALTLEVLKDYVYFSIGASAQRCLPDANGDYKFRINSITKKVICNLLFDSGPLLSGFIDPGDRIKVIFTRTDGKAQILNFCGKGSLKLQVAHELYKTIPAKMIQIRGLTSYTPSALEGILKKTDSLYLIQKGELNRYKAKLDEFTFDSFDAHIFGSIYGAMIGRLGSIDKEKLSNEVLQHYMLKLKAIEANFKSEIACQSEQYIFFYLNRSRLFSRLGNKDPKKLYYNTVNEIATQVDQAFRQKLLISYLVSSKNFVNSEDPELVYSKALSNISNPSYKTMLENLRLSRRKGIPAFNFSLTDINGNILQLSDFRNKIIVIDCWFSTCGVCFRLADVMGTEVIPKFVGRKDIAFLSVNVDNEKEKWVKTLQLKEFSHPGVKHLYTQGLGVRHPFIIHYKFSGFPQLLLIDKAGNMISTDIRGTGTEIIKKIESALDAS